MYEEDIVPPIPSRDTNDQQTPDYSRERLALDRYQGLRLGLVLLRIGPALGLLVLVVVLSQLSEIFLTTRNIGNIVAQTAVIAVLAIGQLLVIITRGIDLSVGSTLALGTVVGALVFQQVDSTPLVVAAMLATGAAVGAINGIVFVKGRLPHPFIITLATLSIARGVALWLSDGSPIQGMPEPIQALGDGSILGWLAPSAFVVVGITLAVLVLTTRMVWGRWIYAVGGNPDAARRTGIPVNGVLISVYVLSGLAAGAAAVLTAGRTNAGAPTFGNLAELDAIAAVIIGGASLSGGRGSVAGTIAGALLLAVLANGLALLSAGPFAQQVLLGTVTIGAVVLDQFTQGRRRTT